MDYNKTYNDFRMHGIHLIISQINIHSTTISGTTGNLFQNKMMFSISEHIIGNEFNNTNEIKKCYDLYLQINDKMVIEEMFIDENDINKLYIQALCLIKSNMG